MGIGSGIARRLHEAGASIVVADRALDEATQLASELNEVRAGSAMAVNTDVTDVASVTAMMQMAVTQFGDLDMLVNNAGIYPRAPLPSMSESDFMRVIDVNLRGVFICTQLGSQRMIDQGRGGKIINVTSVNAIRPSADGLAHYNASKHGVWGLTQSSALELAPHRIWVNAIAPGGVLTAGVQKSLDRQANSAIDAFTANVPMQRMADPDEIGRVALFLASDLASYITGSQIVVDGGLLLN